MDDLATLHGRSLDDADALVAPLGSADLDRPTPCAGWDLAALLAHMIGQHQGFAAALRDGDAPKSAYAPIDFTPATWSASVGSLRQAVIAADPEAAVVLVELRPDPLPASTVLQAHLLDTTVHTWDVARSVGVGYRPADDLIAPVAAITAMIPDDASRRAPGSPFGPVVAQRPSDGWERIIALLGRDPDWTS